jgi:hypothetical protein
MTISRITLFSMALLVVGQAQALSLNGSLAASASATANNSTDYYEIKCSKSTLGDASYLQLAVKNTSALAGQQISLQVTKGSAGLVALNTTDNAGGADTVFSPALKPAWGNTSYFVSVDKSLAGAGLYTMNYTCFTATGKAATTSLFKIWQNQ